MRMTVSVDSPMVTHCPLYAAFDSGRFTFDDDEVDEATAARPTNTRMADVNMLEVVKCDSVVFLQWNP